MFSRILLSQKSDRGWRGSSGFTRICLEFIRVNLPHPCPIDKSASARWMLLCSTNCWPFATIVSEKKTRNKKAGKKARRVERVWHDKKRRSELSKWKRKRKKKVEAENQFQQAGWKNVARGRATEKGKGKSRKRLRHRQESEWQRHQKDERDNCAKWWANEC